MSTRLLVLARTDRRLIRSAVNAACPRRGYRDPREAQPAISRWPRTRYKDREPKGRENSCQEIVESPGDPRPGCAADNRRQHDGSEPELRIRRLPMHARLDLGAVRLLTRTGFDWTRKYPAIAAAIASLPARQVYPRCFNSLDAPRDRFAVDSPLEGAVTSELVSRNPISNVRKASGLLQKLR